MNGATPGMRPVTLVTPASGWRRSDLRELVAYRDLFFFMVWRDIKALYAQTILGFSWAILNPLIQIVIFSVVFGRIARLPTEGVPYVLYSTVAIVPWTFMSEAMTRSSQSLVSGKTMLGKVYFPRLIFPIAPVLSKLVDFVIALSIVLAMMLFYRVQPSWNLVLLPVFAVLMVAVPTAVGLWSSALAIRYRDVNFAMPFIIRMLMYTAPIVYSATSIPGQYRVLYSINPIVGVIEGFRAALLGTPVPWLYIWPGALATALLLIGGGLYFKYMEHVFVDVI